MFRQNADGLMDCSVWRFVSEFSETPQPDGSVLCVQQLVWKPVQFGPVTREWAEMLDSFFARVRDARARINAAG
jgi:hypothetical protein